jgi:hypothetical protein
MTDIGRDAVRRADGSAGDAYYGTIGSGYADYRRPDPRIMARIHAALGSARTVLNVRAIPRSCRVSGSTRTRRKCWRLKHGGIHHSI